MPANHQPTYLREISTLSAGTRETIACPIAAFSEFRSFPIVAALGWPDDVLQQWLFELGDNPPFLADYGGVDLSSIRWGVEGIAAEQFLTMPTGPTDHDCIEQFARNPDHWVEVRKHGPHIGVAESWATHGTWKRWPLLVDRSLLNPPATGLQVVEGRTRVGVLRGRHRQGDKVAPAHLAWVGRAR